MKISVIVIELYVNLKLIFKIGLNQIALILHGFNYKTTQSIMFTESCLLTGTIHYS